MQSIDIVIVNYNSTKFAVRAIQSIKKQTSRIIPNIIVVDNASSDNPERLLERFHDIQLILNSENLGYSKAINSALHRCRGSYVIVMNPDTLLLHGFFEEALRCMENNQRVGIVGPCIFDADGSVQGSARRYPTLWSYAFGRKSPLTRIFPNNSITKREFLCFDCHDAEPIRVDWVSGACMMIRREAFDSVGGFDDDFFLYWEDTDFCKRIADSGWQIVYYPKARVMHLVGASSLHQPVRSILHFHHSAYKLFKKHASFTARFLAPLVAGALTLRCLFVIQLNLVNLDEY